MLQNVSGKARLFFLRELRRSTMWPILIVMSLPCAAVLHYRWPAFVVCLGFVAAMMRELRRGWRTAGSFRGGFFWCANWTLSKVPYSVGFLLALLPKKAGS